MVRLSGQHLNNMINTGFNLAGSGSPMKTSTPSSLGVQQFRPIPTPPPVHSAAPKGTVSSHTVTDAAGNSTVTKYKTPSDSTSKVSGSTSSTKTLPFVGDNGTQKGFLQGVNDSSISQPAQQIPPESTYGASTKGLLNIGQGQNNNPIVGQTTQGLINSGQDARDISAKYAQQYGDIGQQGARAQGGYKTTGTSPVGEGNAAVVAQTTAAQQNAIAQEAQQELQGVGYQQSGLNQAGGLGASQQSQNIGALGNAAGYSSPSFQGYGAGQYVSPLGETIPNQTSQYGAGPQAASNVQSIKDYTTQLNNIDSQLPTIQPTIDALNTYAKSGGLSSDAPFLSALQQKLGTSFASDPSVSGTLQKINTLNSLYQQITGIPGTLDPNKMTVSQLQTTSKAMLQDINNKRKAISDAKDKLNNSGSDKDPLGIL